MITRDTKQSGFVMVIGLITRIAAKVTAHRVGMVVNTFLGRPALQLAGLAV